MPPPPLRRAARAVAAHALGLLALFGFAHLPVPSGRWAAGLTGLLVLVLTAGIFAGLHPHRAAARRLWVERHLRPDSGLARWLGRGRLPGLLSGLLALVLAVSVYVTLHAQQAWEIALVGLAALLAALAMEGVAGPVRAHLREDSAALYLESAIFHLAVLALVTGLTFGRFAGWGAPDPARLQGSEAIAETVRAEIRHGFKPVQDVCRTLVYFDYQVERVRLEHPYGAALHAVFLLPNLLPLGGMIWFLRGVRRAAPW
jgi:hypothetical protein